MSHSYDGSKGIPRSSVAVRIEDDTQIGEAMRAADRLAAALSFDPSARSNLSIVVSEAAHNIRRHAGRGEIVLRAVMRGDAAASQGLELLALDKGPGMADVSQCLRDGFSTAGTAGTGLGAIQRLSSFFAIYSRPGLGTALLSYSWAGSAAGAAREAHEPTFMVAAVNRALAGEPVCGDGWAVKQSPGRAVFLVVDGLGHGEDAAVAARAALAAFEAVGTAHPGQPGTVLERLHEAMTGTRGAAAAVAEWDEKQETVCFAGVGNIAGEIVSGAGSSRMVSHHGIVGYQVRRIQEFTYACPADSLLLLSSDGIATLSSLAAYPGLAAQEPALIAGVLYRDFNRERDDATIVVARAAPRPRLPVQGFFR